MRARLLTVGLMTLLGVGGIATPSFASTGVSVDFCDSAVPGNCSNFTVQAASVSGDEATAVWGGDCTGNGDSIPTLDIQCIYLEVDYPVVP
jgi:hypothetical protein